MSRSKTDWLYAYERIVRRGARRLSKNGPIGYRADTMWISGHADYDAGLTPSAAAKRYLSRFRRPKHRRSR